MKGTKILYKRWTGNDYGLVKGMIIDTVLILETGAVCVAVTGYLVKRDNDSIDIIYPRDIDSIVEYSH